MATPLLQTLILNAIQISAHEKEDKMPELNMKKNGESWCSKQAIYNTIQYNEIYICNTNVYYKLDIHDIQYNTIQC